MIENDESEIKKQEFSSKADQSDNSLAVPTEIGLDDRSDEVVKSDSKIPLKTPVKDEDADVQVKFINDSVNGKCVAQNVISSFSGLSKEELLKYVDDPFWVRMRLLLFIFFWMVWIAMFVSAVAIIVLAPKCELPKKLEWYQQGPLYEVDISKFVDDQGSESILKSMKSKLEYLSELKIKGLILSPVFKADDNKEENVIDFKALDEKFGSLNDFKELIDESNKMNINLILSFVPNMSSNKHIWFNKSVAREVPYDNYYIWAPASSITSNGSKVPPNNWLSIRGGSAWEWVEERQEFYLHQFDVDQPDLNYHSVHVLEELKNIFTYWIGLGVKGFNLDKVQYLLEDKELQNENPNGKPGTIHTQYEFYSHTKTHNIPDVANILSSWRETINKETDGNGILIVTGDVPVPTDSNSTTVVVDICRSQRLLKNLSKNFTAIDLYENLAKIIYSGLNWPSVQLGDRHMKRVSDLFGEENVDGLNMITLLLPATPITYFGEELGLSDNSSFNWGDSEVSYQKNANESHYKVFEALISARDTQTALYGNTSLKVVNDSVLVVTRINLGYPGFLVAYNPSPYNIYADLSNLEFVPSDLMVYTKSIFTTLNIVPGQDKVKSDSVYLESKSAATFTFAPKIEE